MKHLLLSLLLTCCAWFDAQAQTDDRALIETMIEDFQEIAFSQARRAVRNLRTSASKTDVASLSLEDIESEIKAARRITQ